MNFEAFLSFFPVVEPSFTITEESIDHFRQNNEYLPEKAIVNWIEPIEGSEGDEFTEFFPCLRLPASANFEAIIYWKASLLRYEYILATLDKKGKLISKRIVAGMVIDNSVIIKSVANIDTDLIIHIVTGSFVGDDDLDTDSNRPFSMEILPSGEIVSSGIS
jgi:hypothetical protein